MKNFNLVSILLLFVGSFLFIQCTSEPIEGPIGADGADGTASCIACHSESHREAIHDTYNLSDHGIQTTMYTGDLLAVYTNNVYASCTQCHTNEGYIEYQETGEVQASSPLPTAISCTTCHSNHDTFDFENDGPDYALRNITATSLIIDNTYTIDYGNTSNNCVSCHQPRRTEPLDDGAGMYEVTSEHWGPHSSPQSTFIEGLGGALISGSIAYPDVASAAHRTGASCVSCHMAETANGTDGLHSMVPNNNCTTACHSSGSSIPSEVSGLASDLTTLETLLEDVGIVQDGHPVLGTYTIAQAQAAWNYLTVRRLCVSLDFIFCSPL